MNTLEHFGFVAIICAGMGAVFGLIKLIVTVVDLQTAERSMCDRLDIHADMIRKVNCRVSCLEESGKQDANKNA